MGRRKKAAEKWVQEYPDVETHKRALTGASTSTEHSKIWCANCSIEDASMTPYDWVREHVASKRHIEQEDKALPEEA